jgi:hypothetical protein
MPEGANCIHISLLALFVSCITATLCTHILAMPWHKTFTTEAMNQFPNQSMQDV